MSFTNKLLNQLDRMGIEYMINNDPTDKEIDRIKKQIKKSEKMGEDLIAGYPLRTGEEDLI